MVNPAWLEEVREKLVRQGLPQQYIDRFVQELRDHYDDITEEGMSMEPEKTSAAEERMGQPAQLAQAAASEYRRAHSGISLGGYVSRLCGWVLIVCAILAGLGTVPISEVAVHGNDGNVFVESGPFKTSVEGKGNFTYTDGWSVSWLAALICGAALAGGILLVRKNPIKTIPAAR